ncbi:MAG: OmpA family protein [Chthoniobacteraceae bacterium]
MGPVCHPDRRLARRPLRLQSLIDGHIPAGRRPLRKDYGSWELSTDRANASRRALQLYAVDDPLISERVTGYGDTDPLPNTAPESPSNERITISLSAQQSKDFNKKAAAVFKKPGSENDTLSNATSTSLSNAELP